MLIADSLAALSGLAGPVLTQAPAVALSGRQDVEVLDGRCPRATSERIVAELSAAARDIFEHLQTRGQHGEARLVAMLVETDTRGVFEAAALKARELNGELRVLRLDCGDPVTDQRLNGPWSALLAANPRATEQCVAVRPTLERHACGAEPPAAALRYALAPVSRLLVSVAERLSSALPTRLYRRRIGVLSRNELVVDALASLSVRGYLPVAVDLSGLAVPQADTVAERDVVEAFERYREALRPYLHVGVLDAAVQFKLDQTVAACRTYWGARAGLSRSGALPTIDAIVTNAPLTPLHVALAAHCQEAGIPLVGVQHGIGLEISAAGPLRRSLTESTLCRYVLTFNEAAAEVARDNPYARGEVTAIACGLTATHAAQRRFTRLRARRRAVYVSTMLYRGYVQNRPFLAADTQLAQLELALVEKVLEDLPYSVDFKPYPAIRYPDPDPVLARVRRGSRLRIVGTHVDLRYLIGRYQLVISAAATSTIGWCITSRAPFVYLDHHAVGRVSDEARALLEAGAFYFDLEATDGFDRLRAFLDRPLADIERDWLGRSQATARLRRFLGAHRDNAGPRAARAVIRAIREARVAGADHV